MDGVHEALGHIFGKLLARVLAVSLIILVFCYHLVFEVELPCTCENPQRDCGFYITLPPLIILLAQLSVDAVFQRACFKRSCMCCVGCNRFLKALFISMMWVVLVLMKDICLVSAVGHGLSCLDLESDSEEVFTGSRAIWADRILEQEEKVLIEKQSEWVGNELKKNFDNCINEKKWDESLCVGDELYAVIGSKQEPVLREQPNNVFRRMFYYVRAWW
ncbi:hypothetical protein WMY93_027850 [Mugilogobius chulae]|uniref:Uncharacterized protein n=1 Tax=Mugilogobius chulae TaxID=88201 RepID=A0AAW0N613_9GOBI